MYKNVFTSTELKTNLREVKEAAERELVYITENGVIAYVLCSVEIYDHVMECAGREGVWEVAVERVLRDAGKDVGEGRTKLLDKRLLVSHTFEQTAQKLGVLWTGPEVASVIEYVSQAPFVGLEVTERVPRWNSFGDHARSFYCGGYDLVYEHDEATGEVLLCGFVEAVERFELPEPRLD